MIVYETTFLAIKVIQLLFAFLIVVLEIVQAVKFVSYVNDLERVLRPYYTITTDPNDLYFTNNNSSFISGKGGSAIWIFIAMIFTLVSLIVYLILFKLGKIWGRRNEYWFVALEYFFVILWITEVLTNLVWAYEGNSAICYYYAHDSDAFYQIANVGDGGSQMSEVCGAYIGSNVFGWFLLMSFISGGVLSIKILMDARKGKTVNYSSNSRDMSQQNQFQQSNPRQQSNLQQQNQSQQLNQHNEASQQISHSTNEVIEV